MSAEQQTSEADSVETAVPDKGTLKEAAKLAKKQMKLARKTGPVAPWRLSLSVALSAVLTGTKLLDALETDGANLDFALLRSFGVGFCAWFILGLINRVLVAATVRSFTEQRR